MGSPKIDFAAVVRNIKISGGFDLYDRSFTDSLEVIEGLTKIPLYPGDRLFIGQAASVARKMKIVQKMIDAHEKSIRDSLKFYAPPHIMQAFEQSFVTTDFLRNPSFLCLLKGCYFPSPFFDGDTYLPDELTGHWEAPGRNHLPHRILYTSQEIFLAKKICMAIPEIAITLLAFQSSFIEYMQQLRLAILQDTSFLTEKERGRGIKVLDEEAFQWQADPLMKKFLPSVTGHYYLNHQGDLSQPPTEQDFNAGIGWSVRKGAFAHEAGGNKINCPASKTILQTASMTLFSTPETPENERARGFGSLLYALYEACKRQFREDASLQEEVFDILYKRIHFFTSEEGRILYEKHLDKGVKFLERQSLPIKPAIYICASNNSLDRAFTNAIYLSISPMWHNRLVAVDTTPIGNGEDAINRMKKANIILLMLSEHFMNLAWYGQILELAQSLNKSPDRIVLAVICNSLQDQHEEEHFHGMQTVFSSAHTFYESFPLDTQYSSYDDTIVSNVRVLAFAGLLRSMVKKHSAYQHLSNKTE